MPKPTTRIELIQLVETSYAKLRQELDSVEPSLAAQRCIDDWSVKDLLAVRVWWTENVVAWIEAGRRGEMPDVPAPGYGWRDTPRLNAEIVQAALDEPFTNVCKRLQLGFERVCAVIEALSDRELLEPWVFAWAGKNPISRWISINTVRQYTTARTYIRRARRAQSVASE